MAMTVNKYLKQIRDSITWNDEYFDKWNDERGHFGHKFIIRYDYNLTRKHKVKTWGGLITHKIQIENQILIYRISKSDEGGVLIMTIYELHPMWKKFAIRLNRFERARIVYRQTLANRNLLRVFEANHIVSTRKDKSEYGTLIILDLPGGASHKVILLEDEEEVAFHLLATK